MQFSEREKKKQEKYHSIVIIFSKNMLMSKMTKYKYENSLI